LPICRSIVRWLSAVELMRGHTVAHPLRERGWELLMTAQHQAGDVSGALATYRAARTTLVDGLGIEPGPTLHALQRSILQRSILEDEPITTSGQPGRPGRLRRAARLR
jgi:DNA-binding SARP family transcriptional activator